MNKYESFVGKVLDGRYKILELVGMGGMACVLKAQDLVMKRIVAIKILNDEYTGNESAEARFIDESKAVAMLSNKNIVSVYDVAIYPDIKYLVMEYLDGITLREYLDNKGAIGWKEACIYILQILKALEHAHSKGIIHRDIKPQNVMLMKNGDIKVTDFGIAKLPNSVSEQKDEKAVGTVYYISPEQACGKETDYYSDIYSVGVMFYEAVTGTLPFVAETPMQVAMMQVNDEPVHPRDIVLDIPVGVSQIILKAMEKSPSDRFQSAHTMAKAIEWVLKYPDVIFNMNSSDTTEGTVGNSNLVSIDMISTAELEPYEEEITDKIDKKKKKEEKGKKPKKVVKTKKRKTNRTMFPIISGVSFAFIIVAVVILIMVGMTALNTFLNPVEEAEAEFPDLTDKFYSDELRNNLLNGTYGAKFVIDEIIYETRDDMENNKIISTEPEAGHLSKVSDDGKVHFTSITVNRSEKVVVPYLSGLPKTTAQTMLSNLELVYEFVETDNSDNPYCNPNQVIETYPAAGTELRVGDTVTVYLYKRNESGNTAKMPNVIGLNEADAKRLAQTYSLYTVKIEYEETIDGNNRVVEQSIKAGTISPKGTQVVLKITTPMQAVLMPNLSNMTYDESVAALVKVWEDNEIQLSPLYFTVDLNFKEQLELECKDATDLSQIIGTLMTYGCQQVFEDDGIAAVIYQGIATGEEIPLDTTYIDLVLVTYTIPVVDDPEDSSNPEGDTSSEDTSSDVSNDMTDEPDSSEPDLSEPDSSEPDVSEPDVSENESSEVIV